MGRLAAAAVSCVLILEGIKLLKVLTPPLFFSKYLTMILPFLTLLTVVNIAVGGGEAGSVIVTCAVMRFLGGGARAL